MRRQVTMWWQKRLKLQINKKWFVRELECCCQLSHSVLFVLWSFDSPMILQSWQEQVNNLCNLVLTQLPVCELNREPWKQGVWVQVPTVLLQGSARVSNPHNQSSCQRYWNCSDLIPTMLRDQVVSMEFRAFSLNMCQVLPTPAKYPSWFLIFLFPLPHFISRNVTKY